MTPALPRRTLRRRRNPVNGPGVRLSNPHVSF